MSKLALPKNTILCSLSGSRAYNIDKQGSDYDIIGCCIGGLETYFGLKRLEQYQLKGENVEGTIYEIRKYFKLLMEQNPTVLSSLFVKTQHVLQSTWLGQDIIFHRDIFISKTIYKPFIGYAYSQLNKMTHKNAEKMSGKRKEEFETYGYSTKNACHLIRLLKMGIKLLRDGEFCVYFRNEDAQELQSIRNGKWELKNIQDYAKDLFQTANTLYITSKVLPDKIDRNFISGYLMAILKEHFRKKFIKEEIKK